MMILFFTILYLWFIIIDLIPIYKEKKWKLFWIYLSMMALGYITRILIGLGVKIPSPAEPLENMVKAITGQS